MSAELLGSFASLGLAEPLLRAVAAQNYTAPTPIQEQAIPPIIAGYDLLGCAQTGTGKTAAFALPILHRLTAAGNPPKGSGRRSRVLVLSPTRELALQISESFDQYGQGSALRQTVIFGGVSQNRQTKSLQKGVDIIIATPGRLLDLINQGFVDLKHIQILVLDEADRMLDMGFMPDIRRILKMVPQERQTLMFSATMPPNIKELADTILNDPVQVRIAPAKATTDLIEQAVYFVPQQHKVQLLVHYASSRREERTIVFTRTKHGADAVVQKLARAGLNAEAIHGNKSQNARQKALDNFKQNKVRILVATDIAARGIDVDGFIGHRAQRLDQFAFERRAVRSAGGECVPFQRQHAGRDRAARHARNPLEARQLAAVVQPPDRTDVEKHRAISAAGQTECRAGFGHIGGGVRRYRPDRRTRYGRRHFLNVRHGILPGRRGRVNPAARLEWILL